MQLYLSLLSKLTDLSHVVSVCFLPLSNFAFETGGVVLVSLEVLQPQPELLHLTCFLCSQLAHLLQGLHLIAGSTLEMIA